MTQGPVGGFRDALGMATLNIKNDGTFTYDGIWRGYEYTSVTGTWAWREGYLHLTGTGSMKADFGQFSDRAYEATFSMREDGSVVAETGAPGWSLLATREPLLPLAPD